MNPIPELPIFKTVDPNGRGRIGWAFYYQGTLIWSPIKGQAEGARARIRGKIIRAVMGNEAERPVDSIGNEEG